MFVYLTSLHEPLRYNTTESIYSYYLTLICIKWSQPRLHSPRLKPLWHNTIEYINGHDFTLMTCPE